MKRAATAAETAGGQISKALSTAKTVAVGFVGAFVTGELLGLASEASKFASSLGETAEQLGVSAKGLQELRYAATQSGASIEEADKAIGKFSVNVGKARDGNKQLRDAFDNVGVGVSDLRRLNTEELFSKVAEGIAKIPDPARRASAEVALLGKGGQALGVVLNSGADGIRAFADQAEHAGVVVSDKAITALDNLNDSGDRLKLTFNAQLANLIGENAGAIIALGDAAVGALGKLGKLLEQAKGIGFLSDRGNRLAAFTTSAEGQIALGTAQGQANYDNKQVSDLQAQLANLRKSGGTLALQKDVQKELAAAQKLQAETRANLLTSKFGLDMFASKAENTNNFAVADAPDKPGRKTTARAQRDVGDSAKQLQADLKRLLGQYDDTAAAALRYATELNDIAKLQKAGLVDDDKAGLLRRGAFDRKFGLDPKANKEGIDDALKQNEEQLRASVPDIGNLPDLQPLIAQYGLLNQEAQRYAESIPTTAKDFQASFEGVGVHALQSLESGIQGIIQGTESLGDVFKNIAQSIISDLIAIAIKAAIIGPILKVFGISTGGGIGFFADGGDPPVGRASIVGERGPELFVPKTAGTIIPNHALGGGGGSGIIINVDARGSTDPAAVRRQVQLGILEAAPSLNSGIKADTIKSIRRPSLPGGRG